MPEQTVRHFMLPGSHEFPRIPRCKCGFEWDWWNDCCTSDTGNAAPSPRGPWPTPRPLTTREHGHERRT